MASSVKFPIRTKLLLLLSGFSLLATCVYLILAIELFKEDKTELIYELNASIVKTLAAEVESSFGKVIDKVKLLTQGHQDAQWSRTVFESEPLLISYTLYQFLPGASKWTPVSSIRNSDYLKTYGLSTAEVDRIRSLDPISFPSILKKGVWVRNSTFPGGAPVLTLAVSIEVYGAQEGPRSSVAVVDLRMDHILKLLSHRKIATVYLIDSEGKIIAHPDINLVNSHASVGEIPIVRDAVSSPVTLQLKRFEWNNQSWLGAFSSVGLAGLSVISQVPESEAFFALRQLVKKSILFALIIVTSSLLISGWLSNSFTEPLQKLLSATERLARWDFNHSVHVKTRDEFSVLARAFNSMAGDLQNQSLQIKDHQNNLEKKVTERTAELEAERKKLSETQDTLLRTTRLASLGELAGAAAHEVLNPVNNINIRVERINQQLSTSDSSDAELFGEIIQGWNQAYHKGGWQGLQGELGKPVEGGTKTLGEEDLENLTAIASDLRKRISERAGDLEFLKKEIVRITRIINNMRALSRVGGERRPLDIHVPIDETALALADLLEKKKIALVRDFSADPRELFQVVGDKDELVQVFSNLLRNALQSVAAAKRRSGVIRVSSRRADSRVEIRISDNGTGISKENLSRLFEPSFTTKTLEEGTGLGLSISRRFIRAFGGDIEVEKTQEGEGCTFLVWFPAAS